MAHALLHTLGGAGITVALCSASAADGGPSGDRTLRFATDVRPILSEHCFPCHGFDENKREAGLRFDQREGAFNLLPSGGHAIVPGEPENSLLVARTSATDSSERMPPAEFNRPLNADQVATLEQWIKEGAKWEEHWSFAPVADDAPPATTESLKPIDAFIRARLAQSSLEPSPEADPITLLRRVTYDLTGLPPTSEEVEAFLKDPSPEAYSAAVDRLLDSPRYGEHMGRYWLDAARYGDTHGLHLDNFRMMWPYRDWVINAFNENKPFDDFVVEQLAGDLLPESTIDQKVASGFNRCNVTSAEGGMIKAEYLSLYAKDRAETTGTVFLGLTMGCAQCHDHKYDAISMQDYYSMYAFFNSLDEDASDGNKEDPRLSIPVPGREQQAQLDALDEQRDVYATQLDAPIPELDALQADWEDQWRQRLEDRWLILVPELATSTHDTDLVIQGDDSILAQGPNPAKETYEITAHSHISDITGVRLEAMVGEGSPASVPGRAHNQNFVLTHFQVETFPAGHPELAQEVELVSAQASFSQDKYPVAGALDEAISGWAGLGSGGSRSATFIAAEPFGFDGGTGIRVRLKHESQFPQHNLSRVRLAITSEPALVPTKLGGWHSVGPFGETNGQKSLSAKYGPEERVDLDAKVGEAQLSWTDRPEYVDGKVHLFENISGSTYLYREIHALTPRALKVGVGSDDGIRIWLNGELVHDNPVARGVALDQDSLELPLEQGRNELLLKVANYGGAAGFAFRKIDESMDDVPSNVGAVLGLAPAERTPEHDKTIKYYYRGSHSPNWLKSREARDSVIAEREVLQQSLPTTMVSRELEKRRQAHMLIRGQYDQLGPEVQPRTPSALPPMGKEGPINRLDLAHWIVREDNPLTSRVTVNRFWQQFFGTGLVKTSEDFGAQGELPSHPELLDWLARHFMGSGWDVKGLVKSLVTSRTYMQSARSHEADQEQDPYNRLLARGPRFRLDGEMLRDTALFLSDSLIENRGGPSVKPYQPVGVWKAVGYSGSNTVKYAQDQGDALYRRSIYTFWKRTAPPPNMVAFDAPSRESCTVRRSRTNTPLQALALLNDVQMVEAARRLAQRILSEGKGDVAARANESFRWVTSRVPTVKEQAILLQAIESQLALFKDQEEQAKLLIGMGNTPPPATMDARELAAWTHFSLLLLNLDEVITRG
ncbi:MAG: PSD1 and planctomycete cytochrome C domain-containing protein [bacterium]